MPCGRNSPPEILLACSLSPFTCYHAAFREVALIGLNKGEGEIYEEKTCENSGVLTKKQTNKPYYDGSSVAYLSSALCL